MRILWEVAPKGSETDAVDLAKTPIWLEALHGIESIARRRGNEQCGYRRFLTKETVPTSSCPLQAHH